MNIRELHRNDKPISTAELFKTSHVNVTAIQLQKGEQIKEHVSKTPALLLCISGEAVYETADSGKIILSAGDYTNIEADEKHWCITSAKSELLRV